MQNTATKVKEPAGEKPGWLRWVDSHPRTGWYICAIVTLDFLINVLEIARCPLLG